MSLEKILKKIIDEAQEEADKIVFESQKKAKEIKENTQKDATDYAEALMKEAERQGSLEASRIVTQARLQRRLNILSCKKRLIDEVLGKAFQKEGLGKRELTRKVILKDGETEESFSEEKLMEGLRPRLEKYIAEMLKI